MILHMQSTVNSQSLIFISLFLYSLFAVIFIFVHSVVMTPEFHVIVGFVVLTDEWDV